MPWQAQAHCWVDREAGAAQVRKMQTMLMVATLRCRAAHFDISADYDSFVGSQREALMRANYVIKQHFAADGGGQVDYDRFATSLANGFGDGETSDASCTEAAMLAHEASVAPPYVLERLALARVFPATLPGGVCGAPGAPVIATAPPPMPAAAPEPVPAPAQVAEAEAEAPLVELAPPPPAAPAPVAPPRATRVAAALPIVRPEPAPIIPIDAAADEAPAAPTPAPVAVAAAAPPPPAPARAQQPSLPADVLAAMAVMARYQASLASAPTVVAAQQP